MLSPEPERSEGAGPAEVAILVQSDIATDQGAVARTSRKSPSVQGFLQWSILAAFWGYRRRKMKFGLLYETQRPYEGTDIDWNALYKETLGSAS